jgi:resuscitation-promoting factor RpfA
MRLVCPSCDAKYEVPEDAIPESGRDVQCANCGHAWFQMRTKPADTAERPVTETAPAPEASVAASAEAPVAEAAPETPAEPAAPPEEPVADVAAEPPTAAPAEPTEAAAEPDPVVAPEETVVVESVTEAVTEAAETVVSDVVAVAEGAAEATVAAEGLVADILAETASPPVETEPTPAADTPDVAKEDAVEPVAVASASASSSEPPPGYAVDESVLAILREEADREAKARAAEAQRPETPPGSVAKSTASGKKKKPAAVPLDDEPAAETADDDIGLKSATRRDLLPDVEEINSTLRPSEVPVEADPTGAVMAAREPSGGFRTGFLTMMTIAIIGAVFYIAAPTLARLVPGLSDPLMAYVGMVDGLRLSLDGMMRSATVAINGQ